MIEKSALHLLRNLALIVFAILAFVVVSDYMRFRQFAEGGNDVWYSSSWLMAPATNSMLVGRDAKEFWQTNAVGNETWLIREVRYEGTTFWTALRRESFPGK